MIAWLITVSVEYIIWLAWIRRFPIRLLGCCILVNTLTQPLAVWIYHSWALSLPDYKGGHVIRLLLIVETGVITAEWILVKWFLGHSWTRTFWIVLSANAVTTALSFLY
ncbi:hypothetical protein K1X84_09790 [bacterium]|nr:hypothetical protein [bacterium]